MVSAALAAVRHAKNPMTNANTATNAMLIESPSVAEVFEQSPKAQYQQRPHRPAVRNALYPDPEGLRKAGTLTTFHDGVQIDDDPEAISGKRRSVCRRAMG